jgi:hypothetical protein
MKKGQKKVQKANKKSHGLVTTNLRRMSKKKPTLNDEIRRKKTDKKIVEKPKGHTKGPR